MPEKNKRYKGINRVVLLDKASAIFLFNAKKTKHFAAVVFVWIVNKGTFKQKVYIVSIDLSLYLSISFVRSFILH